MEDTKEVCRVYGIKPPSLNADLFERLLTTTDINEELQQSLVRGWREGLDLGAELPNEDQIVEEIALTSSQRRTLNNSRQDEVDKRRLKGPLQQPIRDERWFVNSWVFPYFAIPGGTWRSEEMEIDSPLEFPPIGAERGLAKWEY